MFNPFSLIAIAALERDPGAWRHVARHPSPAAVLRRSRPSSTRRGYYVQSARLVDCTAGNNRKAGFLCKNLEAGSLVLERCCDTGSTYGLVIEYSGDRMRVEGLVSDGATRRALQMVGNDAEVGNEIRNFAGDGRRVLLSITEWLELVDAPSHVEDLKRYRARDYAMKNNRITIRLNRPMEAVEVHPPSANSVNMVGITVEYCPPRPAMG